jgi:hypothetical protein
MVKGCRTFFSLNFIFFGAYFTLPDHQGILLRASAPLLFLKGLFEYAQNSLHKKGLLPLGLFVSQFLPVQRLLLAWEPFVPIRVWC